MDPTQEAVQGGRDQSYAYAKALAAFNPEHLLVPGQGTKNLKLEFFSKVDTISTRFAQTPRLSPKSEASSLSCGPF